MTLKINILIVSYFTDTCYKIGERSFRSKTIVLNFPIKLMWNSSRYRHTDIKITSYRYHKQFKDTNFISKSIPYDLQIGLRGVLLVDKVLLER